MNLYITMINICAEKFYFTTIIISKNMCYFRPMLEILWIALITTLPGILVKRKIMRNCE
jgi:hypothetical protein